MHGTYSLIDERVDLHGELKVDTKFSKTAKGVKVALTRAVELLAARLERQTEKSFPSS